MPERLTPERLAEIRRIRDALHEKGLNDETVGYIADGQWPTISELLAHIDAQQAEIDRLRALLGEAREALDLLLMYQPTCEQAVSDRAAIRSGVLAQLAQEGLS